MSVPAANIEISEQAMRAVVSHCALAGLCPLIPVPFVDDMIIKRIHRRLCRTIARQHGIELSDEGASILVERESALMSGAAKKLLLWPVKKLIRKLVYVLAVASCADVATDMFHEGWLMARALEAKYVDHDALRRGDKDALRHLRRGVVEARDAVDPDATRQAMRSAFGIGEEIVQPVLAALKRALAGPGDETKLEAAERETAPIADRIREEIREHWSREVALDAELRRALEV